MKSFTQYLVEEESVVYFTFGRMNPPTIGHGKLLDKLASKAGRNPYKIFLSQSQDSKKNPLSYQDKVKHVRKMFPKHGRQVMIDKKVRTAIEAVVSLYNQGVKNIVMVVGDDRVREFNVLLNKYNGQKARHGFYNFQKIDVISAGQRDPDAEGAEGASATKQRNAASSNDFVSFSQGVPRQMSDKDTRKLFNAVRKGMGLKEEKMFKNHIQLKPISDRREQYVSGGLYHLGDEVVIKESDQLATITVLGSNYVIVEDELGKRFRKWLDAIEPVSEKKLTPNELKKREKVAKSIHKSNPNMPMDKKMAIATSVAKRTAENYLFDYGKPESVKRMKGMTPGQNEDNTRTPQDPDIKDKKGTQPAKYFKGMSKATKNARDAHFKARKSGPAPGDGKKSTKVSKFTNYVRNMMGESYNSWTNKEPVEYAKHLEKTFGKPDEMTDSQLCWFAKDGFKRIVIKDEYILHGSPAPHYDFIYCYIDLKVPEKFANALAESSGSIMVDYLKGEVGARCGSITANATTLNYVLDVVAGRVAPSKKEYEKRILEMKGMFEKGQKYTTDWWPDESNDADPKNKYYAEGHSAVCGCTLQEKMSHADIVQQKIDREKAADTVRHNQMKQRAAVRDIKSKKVKNEASFEDKAKKSGISVGTLKKVYQRGVAAHKTGHRPGTTPSQWGHARVNAFITKKKRGGLNHDKDLA